MPQIETEKTIHQQIASVARLTFAEWRSSLTTKKSKFRENKKKKQQKLGDIISPKCTKYHNHICYTVPEIWYVIVVIIIFHFGLFFPLLPHWQPEKSKWKKKEKKHLEISSFYTSIPKIIIICYTVSEIRCVMDVIVIVKFGLFAF